MKRHIFLLASVALLSPTVRTSAQEPAYVDDLRFVQELRQRGDTDLALDLLNRLAKDASPQLRNELPFEMALCRKAEAVNETDGARRLKLYEQARAELIKFRDSNPNHPRLAETKIDITDITVQEGKTQLSQAMARQGIEAQSAGLLEARQKFEAAAVELKAITDELDGKLSDPKTQEDRAAHAKLEKTRVRAEYAVALNLFDVAQTYHRDGSSAVLRERATKMQVAAKALQKVASNDDSYSEVWQARAWLARCEQELGEPRKARDRLTPISNMRSTAAADGTRLARYFLLLVIKEQLGGTSAEKGEDVNTLVKGGRSWIRDYPRSLATPEGNGIRYLLAEALLAVAGTEKTPTAQKKENRDEARKLLAGLAETENEWTDRSRDLEIQLSKLEGAFTKDVKQISNFDDCYLRAQYEIQEMFKDSEKIKQPSELEAKRAASLKIVLEALERCQKLADPAAKNATKTNNARAMLAYWYLVARKYAEAIRVGEKFARDDPRSSQAALAAAYALQGYGASIAQREDVLKNANVSFEFADDGGRKITEADYRKLVEQYRTKMLDFAAFCESTWKKEHAGNLAREKIGRMLLGSGKIIDAIKELNAVTPEYTSFIAMQSLIADASFRADAEKLEPFFDPARGEAAPVPFRERALAALRNVKEPDAASADQNRDFYQARIRLVNELYRDRKFAEMESLAAPLQQKTATTTFHSQEKLNGEFRDYYRNQLVKLRLFAKVGQADLDFKANDMKKVADQADPVLNDLKTGTLAPLLKDPDGGRFLQALLLMALQANVQLGDLEKVRLIVDLYGKTVNDDPAANAVPEILRRLVPIIRNQVRDLKSKGDVTGLSRTIGAFSTILDDLKKQQRRQPIPAEFLHVLALCYASMDETEKAIDVLEKISEPLPTDVEALKIYQASRLTYLRQLRQLAAIHPERKEELYTKADKLLNEWMTGTKEKPGWAAKSIEAHKERMYLFDMDDKPGAGFNKAQALVKALSTKITDPNDQAAKAHYLECNYYMIYFLYADAKKKGTAGNPHAGETANAASLIVALEKQYKDFGNEETKRKIEDLLNAEPPLKAAYEKIKK